ncbi:MAG: type I DNA topoisomerase [Ruminococcaceae bacterium]|nr:type I DNA topoisomerase [Oscillospiraceae bacterium]
MSNLVIIESPGKITTIKNSLGSNYKVVASVGHVRDLPKSSLGVDIENDFAAHYINIRGRGQLINELKKEAKAASKVFLATDPDREGEAISWHLINALGIPEEKVKRVTFNEITKTAIKTAIKNPRQIDMGLVNSQQARRILDRIVGYQLSPFLWKTVKSGLSAGRVQSVATRIIVEREKEIREFNPKEYHTIEAILEKDNREILKARFYGDSKTKIELNDDASAKKVVDAVSGKSFKTVSVKKAVKVKNPAPPFTTSTLQQEAARKLGFQSQQTMKTAQELYEGINVGSANGGIQGLITYMRTDSLRISSEAVESARAYIKGKYGDEYCPKAPRIYKAKANAQDAHESIRPVNMSLEPDKIAKYLTKEQYKLYKLIFDRFVACEMSSAEFDTVSADFECEGYIFRTSGSTQKFQGFLAVYEESTDAVGNPSEETVEAGKLPVIKEGEMLSAKKCDSAKHFTEPPPRYNEASLIKFLEEKGIGRPSTFTPIITTILMRGYVVRDGKSLKPTPLGEITTDIMKEYFSDIVDYEFTAQLEDDLDSIEHGKHSMTEILGDFYKEFKTSLDNANQNVKDKTINVPLEETDIICEKCGAKMVIKNGRYGKFAACPNYPECKNTKRIDKDGKLVEAEKTQPEKAGMKCELCGSEMVIRNSRYGSFYACENYPKCKNTKQITKDTGVSCPLCGSKIVSKKGKNKTFFYSCEKYPECGFSSWDLPLNEKCPKCGNILFRKKGKDLVLCHNKDCGYQISAVETDNKNEE